MKQQKAENKIQIFRHSGIYTLEVRQQIPVEMKQAWSFFSSPENLSVMTPPEMNFKITSGKPEKIFAGQIISYKVNALPFIKSNWVTEITQVKEQAYFIDEQRFGPYKMWHHEHHFKGNEKGILMTDRITYKIPFGFLGQFIHSIFIKRKLIGIFSFRIAKLNELFPDSTRE